MTENFLPGESVKRLAILSGHVPSTMKMSPSAKKSIRDKGLELTDVLITTAAEIAVDEKRKTIFEEDVDRALYSFSSLDVFRPSRYVLVKDKFKLNKKHSESEGVLVTSPAIFKRVSSEVLERSGASQISGSARKYIQYVIEKHLAMILGASAEGVLYRGANTIKAKDIKHVLKVGVILCNRSCSDSIPEKHKPKPRGKPKKAKKSKKATGKSKKPASKSKKPAGKSKKTKSA